MAVELTNLYADIQPAYDVKLLTTSCFRKKISWIHTVEGIDFAHLLHGDELVFNSGLNYRSDRWLKDFIDALVRVHAGGLIISVRDNHIFPQEIIDHCNELHFPLFSASWNTPYVDIMRRFSEILLKNEQRETNLIAALKNVIYYPQNEKLYLNHFERNSFFRDMPYTIIILSCNTYDTENGNTRLEQIEKALHYILRKPIVYEEHGRLVILAARYPVSRLQNEFHKICQKDPNVYVGIGTTVDHIHDICHSYENALTAYQLTKTTIPKNLLCYDGLGIYKILADVKDASIYPAFVSEVLGPLIEYDEKNGTDYIHILDKFFENDCSILHTSQALYCHKNTLNYKMNAIKEILDYDIMSNKNRTRIMMAFYILSLGKDYY